MTTRSDGPVLIAGLGERDPLRLLLGNPALVIVADPCAVHRASFELRVAALKCLGHREFLQLGRPERWARLLPRFRWLVPDDDFLAWDGCSEALRSPRAPDSGEFALMKERATRLELVGRPLDDLLSGLPRGFADALFPGAGCGCDDRRLAAEAARVVRRLPVEADSPGPIRARMPVGAAR